MSTYYVVEIISGRIDGTFKYVTHDATLAAAVCGNLEKQFPDKIFVILRQVCRDRNANSTCK